MKSLVNILIIAFIIKYLIVEGFTYDITEVGKKEDEPKNYGDNFAFKRPEKDDLFE